MTVHCELIELKISLCFIFFFIMVDIEVVCFIFELYEEHEINKKYQ